MSIPTPSWSALKRKDLRRTRRYAVEGETLRVSWLGLNGTLNMVQHSRVLNICEEGIAVELPEPDTSWGSNSWTACAGARRTGPLRSRFNSPMQATPKRKRGAPR
jgi:hypothetical protein